MMVAGPDSCSAYLAIYRDTEKCAVVYLAVVLQKGKWNSKFSLLVYQAMLKCLVQPSTIQFVSEWFPFEGPELPYPAYKTTNAIISAFQVRNADFLGLAGQDKKLNISFKVLPKLWKHLSLHVRNVVGNRWCVLGGRWPWGQGRFQEQQRTMPELHNRCEHVYVPASLLKSVQLLLVFVWEKLWTNLQQRLLHVVFPAE